MGPADRYMVSGRHRTCPTYSFSSRHLVLIDFVQLISLIFGGNWHICQPANVHFDDERYAFWVLVEQVRHFGPFNESFEEIADPERLAICTGALDYIIKNGKWLPFSISVDDELAAPDRDFIAKMMKLDPRDRPTARELLEDDWFRE